MTVISSAPPMVLSLLALVVWAAAGRDTPQVNRRARRLFRLGVWISCAPWALFVLLRLDVVVWPAGLARYAQPSGPFPRIVFLLVYAGLAGPSLLGFLGLVWALRRWADKPSPPAGRHESPASGSEPGAAAGTDAPSPKGCAAAPAAPVSSCAPGVGRDDESASHGGRS